MFCSQHSKTRRSTVALGLTPPRVFLFIGLWIFLGGCLGSCPDAQDADAKARIWGPEEPSPIGQEAATPLDAHALATDSAVRRHVLYMSAEEMALRLGSFLATNKVSFEWSRGEDSLSLKETTTLQQSGNGDFLVSTQNDHDMGMELRWVGGVVYEKTKQGKFFERRSDRAGHLRWREAAMEQLPTLLTLTGGRIALAEVSDTRVDGRAAARFLVTNTTEPSEGATPPPPSEFAKAPVFSKGERDASLSHRLAVLERGELRSVTGELLVDLETGVILSYKLDCKLEVPALPGEGGAPASLRFKASRLLEGVVGAQLVERPSFEPFSRRPRALMNPLEWWPDAPKPGDASAGEGDKAEAAPKDDAKQP